MTNIQAAIGLAQMEGVETALSDRYQLALWYEEALRNLKEWMNYQHKSTHGQNKFIGCITFSCARVMNLAQRGYAFFG